MRTTLDLNDDVLAVARVLAAERGISLGQAVSDIARAGLRTRAVADAGYVPTFSVTGDGSPITPEMVREANEDS